MSLIRFDYGSEFDELRREVNQIFAGMPLLPSLLVNGNGQSRFLPAMDTLERDGKLCVTVDLPGMEEKDIDVEVRDDTITIRGSRTIDRQSKNDTWYRSERCTGTFERMLQLPQPIDSSSVNASFDKGVLTVEVPLPTPIEAKPRKVAITSATD